MGLGAGGYGDDIGHSATGSSCLTTTGDQPLHMHDNVTGRSAIAASAAAATTVAANNIHNSALAMSQLGTVYATKRRRRNGKR